jgi:hypothetical protein
MYTAVVLFLQALWDDSFLLGFGLLSLALLGSLPTRGTSMPVHFGSETTSCKTTTKSFRIGGLA